ncbi:unnamed protein product, partial [Polarella glacialis]
MPAPFAWTRLSLSGTVSVSPRAGHSITPTSSGFLLYGGMDGRRNDQGNPSPNSDLYMLKPGPRNTYEWQVVEIDPGSQMPPVRTLHTAVAITPDEVLLFGGLHSTTPYQVLNDGWILDTTCMEWKRIQFKLPPTETIKGSYWKRMTGRIPDHIQATSRGLGAAAASPRRPSIGG